MYNGIGLTTARGSGTNGHVQRNLSFVRLGKKDNVKYKNEAELSKAEAINNRGPNEEILEHERKRKIEVKVLEFEEILEDQDYTPEEISAKVQAFREKLLGDSQNEQLPKDEFGRYAVRETHQVAAAKQEKNAMLRSAFGISEYFVEGSSFDADRKAKEELAKSAALQKELEAQRNVESEKSKQYKLVRTPSREREPADDQQKGQSIEENKGKSSSKSGADKSKKRKKSDKTTDHHDKKKKKTDTSDSSSSSDEDDQSTKKSRRKRKHSSSSDSSNDSTTDSEPSKKQKRHGGHNNDKKKRSDHTKKLKKHRRHSTSSSSSDSDSSSSSSSSSTSTSSSSSSSGSDSHHKRKHRRK